MVSGLFRLIYSIFGLGSAIFFWWQGYTESAIILFISLALVVLGYIRTGPVMLAYRKMRKGEIRKAESLLNEIKRPNWLGKHHHGYYYFTNGYIGLYYNDDERAKTNFEQALKIGLKASNDRAIAHLNLCAIALRGKRKDTALEHYKKAKKLKYSPELEEEFKKVKKKL